MKNIICVVLFLFTWSIMYAQNPVGKSSSKVSQSVQSEKAVFSTDMKVLNFGTITMGTSKTIDLKFINTGKKTLVIKSVYTNCGCTTINYPEEPFAPGKSGVIKVTYTPTDEGPFNKTITINTNAANATESIKIEGITVEK